MQASKHFTTGFIIGSVAYIVLGILMLVFPDTSEKLICYLLGGVALIIGIVCIVSFVTGRNDPAANLFRFDLAIGVVLLVVGIYLIAWPSSVWEWLPVVLGLCVVFDSIIKLQQSLNLKRGGFNGWWIVLLVAVVTAVLGILLVVNAFGGNALIYYIAIVLIADGVVNLGTTLLLRWRMKTPK